MVHRGRCLLHPRERFLGFFASVLISTLPGPQIREARAAGQAHALHGFEGGRHVFYPLYAPPFYYFRALDMDLACYHVHVLVHLHLPGARQHGVDTQFRPPLQYRPFKLFFVLWLDRADYLLHQPLQPTGKNGRGDFHD